MFPVSEGQGDRMKDRLLGCREAIRVNRITVTAFGWLRLFKTRLRMGNFLSGVFLELPHSVAAERKIPFHRERGEKGGSFLCSFVFCLFFLFFLQGPKELCVAFFKNTINNPLRLPQSDST